MILITMTDGTTRLCREIKFCQQCGLADGDYVVTDEGYSIYTKDIRKIEEAL